MEERARGRPIIETLTPSQKRVLQALEEYIARNGMTPTFRELAEELGQGVELVSIPLLGTVPAGKPIFAPENLLGEVPVEAATVRTGKYFALKVSGTSMVDVGINSGDIVIVRQQPLAEHRDIVVALLNEEATV